MKYLKNQKGFTLLEVLIAATLTSMIMIAVYSVLKPTQKLCNTTNIQAKQNALCSQLNYLILERIRFSNDVIVIKNASNYPSDLSGTYSNFGVVCFQNYQDHLGYADKNIKGKVKIKDTLSDTSETQLLSDGIYNDYSLDYTFNINGCDFGIEITCYNIKQDNSITNKYTYKKSIRLVNYELKNKIVNVIDLNSTYNTPDGLDLGSSGKNTYILYKKN